MRRYMKADLRRVYTRKPRLVILALVHILLLVYIFIGGDQKASTLEGFTDISNFFPPMLPYIFGLLELVFIYGDDFRAKTMQIAIGTGLPRQKVVHAKWLDFMLITGLDTVVFTLVSIIGVIINSAINGGLSAGFDAGTFWLQVIMAWIKTISCMGSVMFVMFWMQGIGVTMILYLITVTSALSTLVKFISSLAHLTRFHLHTYTLPGLIDTFSARFVLGHISFPSLIGILVYMMISFALASLLFKKKELEF